MHIEYVCVYVCLCTHTYVCIYAHILTHVDAYTFLSNISFKYCFLVISFIIQLQKPLALLGSWAERLSSKRCGRTCLRRQHRRNWREQSGSVSRVLLRAESDRETTEGKRVSADSGFQGFQGLFSGQAICLFFET